MPALRKLCISHLRNISSLTILPGPSINLILGENGSGKSSILEALHLLGVSRSFRGAHSKPLIQQGHDECTVFAELESGCTLGITRAGNGSRQIRIAGNKAENAAELALKMPLQLINADTFRILEGSPKDRRKYMNWGVFHVEHGFYEEWKLTQHVLQQRNRLLKQGASRLEIEPWSHELARVGMRVDTRRRKYIEKLQPLLEEALHELLPLKDITLEYERGWDSGEELLPQLENSLSRDLRYGYTVLGPQRADLMIKIGKSKAADILSRGQQKMLVGALVIAQGRLLYQEEEKRCLFLLDDLAAELDRNNRAAFSKALAGLEAQVFLTCIERSDLDNCWSNNQEMKLFHVKHGKITE